MQSVLSNLPVGWRFQPTNEELLDHYLKNKRLGHLIHGFDIQDIQICDFDPWDLLDENSRDKERYLFCRREFHLKSGGTQRKRKAKAGYWKRTGEIQFITLEDCDDVIGTKKIFVYHDPHPTEYVKHEFEYTAQLDSPVQDDYDYVLCRLMITKKKKANKKANKVEPVSKEKEPKKIKNIGEDYNKTEPNKKGRKGLAYCDTASGSVPGKQKQENIMAHSAYGEGEPSDHKTSDFRCQIPNNRRAYSAPGEGEPSKNLTSDNENQAYSACGEGEPINNLASDYENISRCLMAAISTFEKGESSHQGVSDFEYQNMNEMSDSKNDTTFPVDCDFNNQISEEISMVPSYITAGTSGLVAADLENKNPNVMAKMSSSNPGFQSSSWVENDNPCERNTVSKNKKSETSNLIFTSDFGNQNPSQVTAVSANLEIELADDLDNQIPNDMAYKSSSNTPNDMAYKSSSNTPNDMAYMSSSNTPNDMAYMSSYETPNKPGGPSSSWVENQSRNQSEMISVASDFDFENQNPSENTNISVPLGGKWSPPKAAPPDFGKQNQYEKTDSSNPECCRSALLASGVQETSLQEVESLYKETNVPNLTDLGAVTFPEINSEVLDELTELDDLMDTLCSEPTQPLHTKESLIDSMSAWIVCSGLVPTFKEKIN